MGIRIVSSHETYTIPGNLRLEPVVTPSVDGKAVLEEDPR